MIHTGPETEALRRKINPSLLQFPKRTEKKFPARGGQGKDSNKMVSETLVGEH